MSKSHNIEKKSGTKRTNQSNGAKKTLVEESKRTLLKVRQELNQLVRNS